MTVDRDAGKSTNSLQLDTTELLSWQKILSITQILYFSRYNYCTLYTVCMRLIHEQSTVLKYMQLSASLHLHDHVDVVVNTCKYSLNMDMSLYKLHNTC